LTFTSTLSNDNAVRAKSEVVRTWTVGELADELGVTTRTLRFYEAEGLVAPQRSLQTLLGRLDEIAVDLRARRADIRRTLGEVTDVAAQCRARLRELGH